jgi:PLP dependent protein
LQALLARIAHAAAEARRRPGDVSLLAVSKGFSAQAVRALVAAGQTAFGESYLQEALAKQRELAGLPIEWHFIGPIQSNKTRLIAEHFDWVHSVDRIRIAERLNEARPAEAGPLNVCIQVNIGGEESKGGVMPADVRGLAQTLAGLPRLRLRGLMSIPRPTPDVTEQRAQFGQLRDLRDRLNAAGFDLDTLSMGMSADLEAAVMEGATIVRVGTALFGRRTRATEAVT